MIRASVFLVICMIAASAPNACLAGWHHRHGCGSCGNHWHRSHASHGSQGSSFGGSSGGSAGSSAAPAPKPAAPPAGKASNRVPATGALLVLEVPSAATVVINGQRTNLTGTVREFVASGLAADGRYEYEVTMLLDDGGRQREITRTVWLSAGTEQTLAFTDSPVGSLAESIVEKVKPTTALTLMVPSDAKVWIEGRLTSPSGPVRRFSTTELARGASWDGYEIRVVTTQDGESREVVRRITLTGGESVELAIGPASAAPGIVSTAATR